MDETSTIAGEVVDDDGAAEAFLSLMAGDPALAANTVADVLEAAAEMYTSPDTAAPAQLIYSIVNELDPVTRLFLETLADATRRRQIFLERMPFADWISNSQLGIDPLVDKINTAIFSATWPELATYTEYREHLTDMVAAGEITAEDLRHFQLDLWPKYVAYGLGLVGDECSTTQQWQYGVEVRWGNEHRERLPESEFGTTRLEAEKLYQLHRSVSCRETSGKPVLQRRLSVHGPWVDVQ